MVIHKSETVETRINACQWYWSSIIHQFSSPRILLWYVTYYCDNIYIYTYHYIIIYQIIYNIICMYLSCMICRPTNYTQALPQAAPSTFISLVPVENDTAKWQVQSVKSLFFDSLFVILTFFVLWLERSSTSRAKKYQKIRSPSKPLWPS